MPDQPSSLPEAARRIVKLEQTMDQHLREIEGMRRVWSDRDIESLRVMLNGWIAAAAVKAFWRSFTGKAVILTAILIQLTTFGMALLNTWTLHH